MSIDLELKRGEAKRITFTVTDISGDIVDLTGVNPTFKAKFDKTLPAVLFTKTSGDFVLTYAQEGVISVNLTEIDTNGAGDYIGEIKLEFNVNSIDKSKDISICITEAVT